MTWYRKAWIGLFGVGAAVEVAALVDRTRGDTLSEHVWLLRTQTFARVVILPAWTWLTYHFFIESDEKFKQGYKDDIALVVGATIAAAGYEYQRRH